MAVFAGSVRAARGRPGAPGGLDVDAEGSTQDRGDKGTVDGALVAPVLRVRPPVGAPRVGSVGTRSSRASGLIQDCCWKSASAAFTSGRKAGLGANTSGITSAGNSSGSGKFTGPLMIIHMSWSA